MMFVIHCVLCHTTTKDLHPGVHGSHDINCDYVMSAYIVIFIVHAYTNTVTIVVH